MKTQEKTSKLLINFPKSLTDDLKQEVFLVAIENTVYSYSTRVSNTYRFQASIKDLITFTDSLKTKLSEADYESLNITAIF